MTSINPASWMSDDWADLAGSSLKSCVIPGSHDSGMSELHGSEANKWAQGTATQTQQLNIQQQIVNAGVRYLDVRPVYYTNSVVSDVPSGYYLAHYNVLPGGSWVGLIGQSLSDVCKNLSGALTDPSMGEHEIIFVELSHGARLNEGLGTDPLTDDDQRAIMDQLLGSFGGRVFTCAGTPDVRIDELPLKSISGSNGTHGPIVVLWCSDGTFDSCGRDVSSGYFTSAHLPYKNSWAQANTDDPDTFIDEMTGVVRSHTPNDDALFVAWHLTWSRPGDNLRALASTLNPQLAQTLTTWRNTLLIGDYDQIGFIAWDFVSSTDLVPLESVLALHAPDGNKVTKTPTSNNQNYRSLGSYYPNADWVQLDGNYLTALTTVLDGNQIVLQLTVEDGDGAESTITGHRSGNYISMPGGTGQGGIYADLNRTPIPGRLVALAFCQVGGNQLSIAAQYVDGDGAVQMSFAGVNSAYFPQGGENTLGDEYMNTNPLTLDRNQAPVEAYLWVNGNQIVPALTVEDGPA